MPDMEQIFSRQFSDYLRKAIRKGKFTQAEHDSLMKTFGKLLDSLEGKSGDAPFDILVRGMRKMIEDAGPVVSLQDSRVDVLSPVDDVQN